MNIGIVTDSTADLPADLAQKWEIEVVPTLIMMSDQTFKDGEGMSREEFYTLLPDMEKPPTTAAPSPEAFMRAYKRQLEKGNEHVLVLTAPANLSGIHNAAVLAKEEFDGRITVFDSGQLSLGLGFQVLIAAKMAALGKSVENIISHLGAIKDKIHLYAMLNTTKQLKRSGRVGWASSMFTDLLQIKLFIQLENGNVHRAGMTRTRSAGLERLTEKVLKIGPMQYLAVLHTNAYDDANKLLELVRDRVEFEPLIINVTTIIGNHVGSNGVGFVAVTP